MHPSPRDLDLLGARAWPPLEQQRVGEYRDGGGAPLAVGMGVLDGAAVGIVCLATVPSARRRGCARAVLSQLTRWAGERGARLAHLAVVEQNEPARRLYAEAGFAVRQSYAYLTPAGS